MKKDSGSVPKSVLLPIDTSGYPKDHPAGLKKVNKKVIGMMKDEYKGRAINEYSGTCAKTYALTVSDYPGMCDKEFCDGSCEKNECVGNGGKKMQGS